MDALLRARDAFDMKVDVLEPLPHCAFDEPQYLELLDRTCTAGLTWVAISPSGDVRPCTHFDTSYGNILKEGLKASWDSMGAWKSESMIPRECKEDCREYVYCGGGCRASALCTGDASNNDLLMTEAITEPRYHKPFVEVKYTADDTFVLNPRARYRNEGFGITVYVNPKLVCFLNEDAKKLLAALGNMKRFGVRDITNYVEGDPNGITKYLLGRGVLNKV